MRCNRFSSVALLCPTLWTATHQAALSITNSQSSLKLISIESVMPSHPLSSPSLPAFNLPQHQVFSNESVLRIRWPKYWSFSFNISPFNKYSGLISFRIDWFDLLAVRWTFKSLLHYHSLKVPILQHSAFFMVQLSHPYTALTRRTFVSEVVSLLCNTLSRLVIAFLPRSRHLLIS